MIPPMKIPTFTAFEEHGEVPKMLPLDFTEDVITGVTSNISIATGALGAEVIEPEELARLLQIRIGGVKVCHCQSV